MWRGYKISLNPSLLGLTSCMGNSHTTQFGSIPPKGQLPVKEETPEKTTTRWQSLQGQVKEKNEVPPEEGKTDTRENENRKRPGDSGCWPELWSGANQNIEGASTAHRGKRLHTAPQLALLSGIIFPHNTEDSCPDSTSNTSRNHYLPFWGLRREQFHWHFIHVILLKTLFTAEHISSKCLRTP